MTTARNIMQQQASAATEEKKPTPFNSSLILNQINMLSADDGGSHGKAKRKAKAKSAARHQGAKPYVPRARPRAETPLPFIPDVEALDLGQNAYDAALESAGDLSLSDSDPSTPYTPNTPQEETAAMQQRTWPSLP